MCEVRVLSRTQLLEVIRKEVFTRKVKERVVFRRVPNRNGRRHATPDPATSDFLELLSAHIQLSF